MGGTCSPHGGDEKYKILIEMLRRRWKYTINSSEYFSNSVV